MITFPNAKINLGLNIVEKRPDGYHNLETVFYPIAWEDALEVVPSGKRENGYVLHLSGLPVGGNNNDNLVAKACRMLQTRHGFPPVDIFLRKNIPMGAGLGGGSSDAAFMIKLLNELFHLGMTVEEMEETASSLGADCAFFIRNKPVFASGTGNVFEEIPLDLSGRFIVVVKPDIFVSTKEAFSRIKPHRPMRPLKEIIALPVGQWKEEMKNDFEESVFPLHPSIRDIKEKLYEEGAAYASMSGSGSAVYGIFDTPPQNCGQLFPGASVWNGRL